MWLSWIVFLIFPSSTLVQSFHLIPRHSRYAYQRTVAIDEQSQKTHHKNRRTNHKVRGLLDHVLNRLNHEWDETKWSRLRNYLYRSQEKLTEDQVKNVLDFLLQHLEEKDAALVLQQSPRILRKNAKTSLEPTYQFLKELYGESLLSMALKRNPDLLLTRGAGYDGGVLELVEVFLAEELALSQRQIATIKKDFPVLFQTPVSKLLSTVYLFRTRMEHQTREQATAAIAKLMLLHPQVFILSVESIEHRIEFLVKDCGLDTDSVVRNAGFLLGLSIEENLEPKLKLLLQYIPNREKLATALKSHPQILGLAQDNLQAKVSYFDRIDADCFGTHPSFARDDSLASRILMRATPVLSLSLKKNIIPKIDFLAKVWGIDDVAADARPRIASLDTSPRSPRLSLSKQLRQYPSILSLSLEGNIRPTAEFYNRTNYIELDSNWRLQPWSVSLRGRDLAASLPNRLLPRWHFFHSKQVSTEDRNTQRAMQKGLSLHILVSATDTIFCDEFNFDTTEYSVFKREAIPRLKFSSQFDTWIKTGRPIDV
ncbi:hypothetical protein FisN_3Lh406 [Fistulifera solaris]|uniref:mTERF domain-containing protein, mitochondrial n=1 Tax=Fistulifera solaris TaxID=1519565 RepID=A0A1Z5J8C9_FISSO|nr:hypothetical protein FisN_3Lh406 [Fistulifera solaris]|eukprot:GAX10209.1 hypothetical protein FisN_3Lh406 [Fistulifera solaris]